MWLIDTNSGSLVSVTDPTPGTYAILSHTWGPDEDEVTFHDYQKPEKAKQKHGFKKIERTCEIARNRGLAHAWIDTCCIDKSSSAELSEAINSMFKWYENSAFCIVYLEDLANSSDLEASLHSCRWLTRGWTLQELIAPRHVEFYDQAWAFHGLRSQIAPLLSHLTGIDLEILQGNAEISSVPIARRMSWASNRTTKRVEDEAYCLMGIFNVNMPMIYGEESKAFLRLQKEISNDSGDTSLFAWTAKDNSQSYRGIFAQSPKEFSSARGLKNRIKGLCLEKEYSVTNKGVKMETALIRTMTYVGKDLVLPFSLADHDDWHPQNSNGWKGIYLAKVSGGYVRSRPNELYTATGVRYLEDGDPIIHIRSQVSAVESMALQKRFQNAVILKGSRDTCRIQKVMPPHLWDAPRELFLHEGRGINAYVALKLAPFQDARETFTVNAIVACSTMQGPYCAIWLQDEDVYNSVRDFMETRTQATDYIGTDYLAFPAAKGNQPLLRSSSRQVRSNTSKIGMEVNVTLGDCAFEGVAAFALHVEVREMVYL